MNLNPYYYMASSASGQDEPNRVLWLATRAGKMEPSCPLGTTRCIPQAKFHQKPYNKSLIDQVCSVKMARYWPRSFFASLWTSTLVSVHKHAKKELGQYLAILTSHLVNNPYTFHTVWNNRKQMLGTSSANRLLARSEKIRRANRADKRENEDIGERGDRGGTGLFGGPDSLFAG